MSLPSSYSTASTSTTNNPTITTHTTNTTPSITILSGRTSNGDQTIFPTRLMTSHTSIPTTSLIPDSPTTNGGVVPSSSKSEQVKSGLVNWYFALLILAVLLMVGAMYGLSLRRKRRRDLGGARVALERDLRSRFFGSATVGAVGERRWFGRDRHVASHGMVLEHEDLPAYQAKETPAGTERGKPPDYEEVSLGSRNASQHSAR